MGGLAGVAGGLRGFSVTLGVQVASGVWVTSGMPIVGGGVQVSLGGCRWPWGLAGGHGGPPLATGGPIFTVSVIFTLRIFFTVTPFFKPIFSNSKNMRFSLHHHPVTTWVQEYPYAY